VFSESIGTHFNAVIQHLIGTKIEEGAGHDFLGIENPYSPYGHAQNSRGRTIINSRRIFQGIGTFFKALFCWKFSYSLSRNLARKTRTVRTAINVVTVVQWYGFLVQKSRSKLQEKSR
jgi:hypothetical protein